MLYNSRAGHGCLAGSLRRYAPLRGYYVFMVMYASLELVCVCIKPPLKKNSKFVENRRDYCED